MTHLLINGRKYSIEFRHVTKLGKRAQLYSRAPVAAVTTCVILQHNEGKDPVIAIDNSICSNDDNFSRYEGRVRALHKALDHCGALRDDKAALLQEYLEIETGGQAGPPRRQKMPDAEKDRLRLAGEPKRIERRSARGEAISDRGAAK